MPTKKSTQTSDHRHVIRGRLIIIVGSVLLLLFVFLIVNRVGHAIDLTNTPKRAIALETFPAVPTDNLSESQKKVVNLLSQEFATQPKGTKYTEGAVEPWCADFVSWIMHEAGTPLLNKSNGSWRIEEIPPLLEYYKSAGLFEEAGNGYPPKVGDIAIYKKPSNFGNHTNIVIKNDNGTITTVGGNESNTIRVRVYTPEQDRNFVGYGRLPLTSTL